MLFACYSSSHAMSAPRTIIVTGSAGLIGSETVKHFAKEGARVVGIDNDMRAQFFGAEASTKKTRDDLVKNVRGYEHHNIDIRDSATIYELFKQHRGKIDAVVHTAAQPSHDWAARDPQTDFTVNANGTLNLLEAARKFLSGSAVRFYIDEQSLRRHAEPAAAARTGETLGDRARTRIRAGNFRDDEHRLHEAFALRRIESRGRYSGPGIRPLLRNADGLFSRRLPDRPRARRHRAARISLLLNDLHRERPAVSRLRLQRQTSARQHSQLRSRRSVCRIHPRAARRPRSTTSAAAATAIARCSKRSRCAKKSAGRN